MYATTHVFHPSVDPHGYRTDLSPGLASLHRTVTSLHMTVVFLFVFRYLCFLCSAFFLRDRFSQGSRAEASELPMW